MSFSKRYRGAVFDLDGTLLDTIGDIAQSLNAALAECGFPGHDVETCKKLVGEGLEALVRKALPAGRADALAVRRCVELFIREYAARGDRLTRPYAGIEETLGELARRGVALGVLSNKRDEPTRRMARDLLPFARFDAVMGARPDVKLKPDPEGALLVAGMLGLPPAELVYVGDSGVDMETATRAGMLPVGVLWGFRPADELLAAGAMMLVAAPAELLPLFE